MKVMECEGLITFCGRFVSQHFPLREAHTPAMLKSKSSSLEVYGLSGLWGLLRNIERIFTASACGMLATISLKP